MLQNSGDGTERGHSTACATRGGYRGWDGGAGSYGVGTRRLPWGTPACAYWEGVPMGVGPARAALQPRVSFSHFPDLIYRFFLINGPFPIHVPQTIAKGPGTAPQTPFNFTASSSKARDAISPNSKSVRAAGVRGSLGDSQVLN